MFAAGRNVLLIMLAVAALVGVIGLLVYYSDRCEYCGAKLVRHKEHWNMLVCPECKAVRIQSTPSQLLTE